MKLACNIQRKKLIVCGVLGFFGVAVVVVCVLLFCFILNHPPPSIQLAARREWRNINLEETNCSY